MRVYSSTDENALVARTRTGDDGSYRVRAGSLEAGTYRVLFSVDDWWESADSWSTATDVAISAGQSARLDADGTWTLAGMVGGDPETATEFLADFLGGFPVDAGDVTLDS